MSSRKQITCSELQRRYIEEQQGVVTVAAHFACSAATISNRLRDCGIPARSGRFQPRAVSPEALRQMYEVERLPLKQIATRLGVSLSTVSNRRRTFDIAVRPRAIRRYQTLVQEMPQCEE